MRVRCSWRARRSGRGRVLALGASLGASAAAGGGARARRRRRRAARCRGACARCSRRAPIRTCRSPTARRRCTGRCTGTTSDAADLLIRAGAQVDAVTDLGVPPLWLACANGRRRDGRTSPRRRVRPCRPRCRAAKSALMACARTGTAARCARCSPGAPMSDSRERERGQTALMWAVAGKHPAVVELLIQHGADVNAAFDGRLHAAAVRRARRRCGVGADAPRGRRADRRRRPRTARARCSSLPPAWPG